MPFVWMISTAFKTEMETMRIPMQFFPETLQWENFLVIFDRFSFGIYYINSIITAIGITIPQLLLSSMAAYAFARIEFPGKNFIFVMLMMALMVPLQMILVPRFVLMVQFGWVDSLLAVIVPSIASIFATFFIRQHIMTIPKELDESAYLEGCSHFGIFRFIILPLCKSTLAAMGILALTFSWNTLLWPLTVLSTQRNFTLPIGIAHFQGQFGVTFNYLMAGATAAVIPLLVAFLIGQKYFLEGIATSGLKA
jgi:multiple sugar transport system permease protein